MNSALSVKSVRHIRQKCLSDAYGCGGAVDPGKYGAACCGGADASK